MIVILKENPNPGQLKDLTAWLKSQGVEIHTSHGQRQMILGLVGDTSRLDMDLISALDIVDEVKRVQDPYKAANRKFHPEDTVVELANGVKIGGGHFALIAGPCSVESEEQICSVALAVKAAGANILRGGAFKPRTSPYSFQGMRERGIQLLLEAKRQSGLPVVTEIMDAAQLPLFEEVDIIQVGARNMQNFELLHALGHIRKPILLKRGLANTYQELLMSAEHIMSGGNSQVMLCERGIRTFATYTRNTLDLTAIPVLHKLSHLPVIIDPSHASGRSWLVPTMGISAAATGADGLIIEVHNDPEHAWCDGPQSITPAVFQEMVPRVHAVRRALGLEKGEEEQA